MGIEWGAQILRATCVIIGPREYAEFLNINKDITTKNDGNSASMHNTVIKLSFLACIYIAIYYIVITWVRGI